MIQEHVINILDCIIQVALSILISHQFVVYSVHELHL